MNKTTCDRCGKTSEILIQGEHIRPDGNKPFQICGECDDEVFFQGVDWSDLSAAAKKARATGKIGRTKKWNSIKEKNKHYNDKRRGKLKAE